MVCRKKEKKDSSFFTFKYVSNVIWYLFLSGRIGNCALSSPGITKHVTHRYQAIPNLMLDCKEKSTEGKQGISRFWESANPPHPLSPQLSHKEASQSEGKFEKHCWRIDGTTSLPTMWPGLDYDLDFVDWVWWVTPIFPSHQKAKFYLIWLNLICSLLN